MIVFFMIFAAGIGLFQYLVLSGVWNLNIRGWVTPLLCPAVLWVAWYVAGDEMAMYTLFGLFILTFALAVLGIIVGGVVSAVQGAAQDARRIDRKRKQQGLPPRPWWRKLGSALVVVIAPLLFLASFVLLGPAGFFLIFFVGPLFLRLLRSRNPHSFIKLQEILPTSRIRSVATGLAEVEGRLEGVELLQAPMDEAPCIGYRYTVEQESTDSDGDTHYSTITDRSECNDFFIRDKTGRLAVSKERLDLLWLPVDQRMTSGGHRYTQYLLRDGDKMLLIGDVQPRENGVQRMARHPVYDVFTMAPSSSVSRYNRYKPLLDAVFMYLGLLGLLVAIILLTPMDIVDGQLVIDTPTFFFDKEQLWDLF